MPSSLAFQKESGWECLKMKSGGEATDEGGAPVLSGRHGDIR